MSAPSVATKTPTRIVLTRIPDSWKWVKPDIAIRLAPFAGLYVIALVATGDAGWLGWSFGDVTAQLVFAAIAAPVMFGAAAAVQLWLTRRRGAPAGPARGEDAAVQGGFYVGNGAHQGGLCRGLGPGGVR